MGSLEQVVAQLRALANPANVAGQARFGIRPDREILGLSAPQMRAVAKPHRGDHALALALWDTGIHEARHVAAMIDVPARVTSKQMDDWAASFDSWDICDGVCWHLFDRTRFAQGKIERWRRRRQEFVKRAAFAMIAGVAVHDKEAPDSLFRSFIPMIEDAAADERHYVKRGVSWALREVGKRNRALHRYALACGERLRARPEPSARWIASDALRELRGDKVRERLALR